MHQQAATQMDWKLRGILNMGMGIIGTFMPLYLIGGQGLAQEVEMEVCIHRQHAYRHGVHHRHIDVPTAVSLVLVLLKGPSRPCTHKV